MLYDYKCVIRRIVDGDTIDCDIDLGFDVWVANQRVRIAHIDAPETRTRDEVEERMGELAESFVNSKLPVGTETIIRSLQYKPRDMYGRIIADFIVPNTEFYISEMLLEGRYAANYYPDDKERIMEEHMANREYWLEKLDG